MLDPQVSAFLATLPKDATPIEQMSPSEARSLVSWDGLAAELPLPRGEKIDLQWRGTNVPAKVYRGVDDEAMPTIMYFHGGAWVVGSVGDYDNVCRSIALLTGSTVVSVDYRLAPEYRFPIPAEDCYAASAAIGEARRASGTNGQLGLMGDSAGGNLAASEALMARDRGDFRPSFQVLVYPVVDFNPNTRSMLEFAEGYYLTREGMIWSYDHYCPDLKRANRYAAPLQAANLKGLPPTLILTADHDPLHDEGEAYARRLHKAAVPTTLSCYSGQIHGFFVMTALFTRAWSAAFIRAHSRRPAINPALLLAQPQSLVGASHGTLE
jgi:acetyl esterase